MNNNDSNNKINNDCWISYLWFFILVLVGYLSPLCYWLLWTCLEHSGSSVRQSWRKIICIWLIWAGYQCQRFVLCILDMVYVCRLQKKMFHYWKCDFEKSAEYCSEIFSVLSFKHISTWHQAKKNEITKFKPHSWWMMTRNRRVWCIMGNGWGGWIHSDDIGFLHH